MLAKLDQHAASLTPAEAGRARHVLFILCAAKDSRALAGVPFADTLEAALKRRRKKLEDITKSPIATDLPHGALASWFALDPAQPPFEQYTHLRKALQPLFAEKPREIAIAVFGEREARALAAARAVYAAWVNGAPLPERKKKPETVPLERIRRAMIDSGV